MTTLAQDIAQGRLRVRARNAIALCEMRAHALTVTRAYNRALLEQSRAARAERACR